MRMTINLPPAPEGFEYIEVDEGVRRIQERDHSQGATHSMPFEAEQDLIHFVQVGALAPIFNEATGVLGFVGTGRVSGMDEHEPPAGSA